ncbi:hypothetical protein RB595_007485 [Gaeumannomyces hyphopodioides]
MSSQYHHLARDARELEAGLPIAHSEKARLTSTSSTHPEPRDQPRQNMLAPRRLFLGLAVCVVLWLGLTTAAPTRQNSCLPPHDVQDANSGSAQAPLPGPAKDMASSTQTESPFACLMDAVSPEALHEALHRYFPSRFKDGVYESDHSAMEAVHRANPPLATSLARIARRQAGGNGTTPGPTTSTTTTPPVTTPSTPTTQLPRTTPNPDTTPSISTSTTTRPQSSNPGTLTSSTSSRPASSLSTLTGSVVSATTSVTARTSSGADTETTPTPTRTTSSTTRSQKPQTTTYTSTASDGAITIVTATTFVPAEPAETTGGTQAGGSLQTNAAVPRPRGVGVEALAGVVIGGLFLV